jgi:hypothetical protein
MVDLGVSGPEHRTSRLAGAVSIALHGAAVWLVIALGGKHLVPAKQPVLTPIEVVPAAARPPSPAPPARPPTAARPAAPRAGAGGGRREPVQRAQPTAPPAVQSLASVQVRYDGPRTFTDHAATVQAGATRATGSSGIGAGLGDRLADGIGNLAIPEPPAAVSLARPPRPRHADLNQRIVGASRFAGQTLKLLLSIDEHGRVRGVQVVQGVDPEIDRKTAERVRGFEFDPALDDAGVAIAGTKRCEFEIVKDDDSFEPRGPR